MIKLALTLITNCLVATTVVVQLGCLEQDNSFIGNENEYLPLEDNTQKPFSCPDPFFTPFNNAESPFRFGDKRTEVAVDVVVDFHCPYCALFASDMEEIWHRRSDFNDLVRIYFHHFPMESIHPGTTELHVITAAVAKQGYDQFWNLHDWIFRHRDMSIRETKLYIQQDLGLDMDKFQQDMERSSTKDFVQWDKFQSKNAMVKGTPTVFICGEYIADRSYLEEKIDQYLYGNSLSENDSI